MKKIFNTQDVVIISEREEDRRAYPVGFKYILGETIYTVTKQFRSDNTEMRALLTSRGEVQHVMLATIRKDAADPTFRRLEDEVPPGA